MIREALRLILLTSAFTLGTWLAWWTVPVIALAWTIIPVRSVRRSAGRPVREAILAATLAWAFWLGYDWIAGAGGLVRLGTRLGALLHLPLPLLLLVSLVFPALLAGAAAVIGNGLRAALPDRVSARSTQ